MKAIQLWRRACSRVSVSRANRARNTYGPASHSEAAIVSASCGEEVLHAAAFSMAPRLCARLWSHQLRLLVVVRLHHFGDADHQILKGELPFPAVPACSCPRSKSIFVMK